MDENDNPCFLHETTGGIFFIDTRARQTPHRIIEVIRPEVAMEYIKNAIIWEATLNVK